MSRLSIGIEACGKGGTILCVADESGNIIAADKDPIRLNYYEESKTSLGAELYHLIKKLLQKCGLTVTDFCSYSGNICAGITGITTKYDRKIGMLEVWRAAGLKNANVISTGGVEIEFTGATRSLCGAVVSCHTGSAALARTEQVIRRVGGWGPLIGDEGSGYWIGSKIINILCRFRDERLGADNDTKLPEFIREELKDLPVWQEISKQYLTLNNNHWTDAFLLLSERTMDSKDFRYIISDLAQAAFNLYKVNPKDELVSQIINDAADELTEQVLTVIRRAELSSKQIPIVFWGGVFRYNESFCNLVKGKITKKLPNAKIILPTDPIAMRPVIGSLLFSLSGTMFSLPSPDVIKRVEETSRFFKVLKKD